MMTAPAPSTLSAAPDRDLVRDSRAGSSAAFEELVNRHFGTVYAIAWVKLRRREAAEELAQEAFLRAWLNIKRLHDSNAFAAWVCRMTANLATDWQRREMSRSKLLTLVPLEAPMTSSIPDKGATGARDRAAEREERAALEEALRHLDPEDRDLIIWHYNEDLSHREIAARLSVHHTTVGRRIDKAVTALKRLVEGPPAEDRDAANPLRAAAPARARACAVVAAAAAMTPEARAAVEALAASTAPKAAAGGAVASAATTGAGSAATGAATAAAGIGAGKLAALAGGAAVVLGVGGVATYNAVTPAEPAAAVAQAPAQAPEFPEMGPVTATYEYKAGEEMVFEVPIGETTVVYVPPVESEVNPLKFYAHDENSLLVEVVNGEGGESTMFWMWPGVMKGGADVPPEREPNMMNLDFTYGHENQDGQFVFMETLYAAPADGAIEVSVFGNRSSEFNDLSDSIFQSYFMGRSSIDDAWIRWAREARRYNLFPTYEPHARALLNTKQNWNSNRSDQ